MITKYLIGNWKAGPETKQAAQEFFQNWNKDNLTSFKIGLAVPTLYLEIAKEVLSGTGIMIWAQDCASMSDRTQTGKITVEMLQHYVNGVILNHSEVNDTIPQLTRKITQAIKANLKIILCLSDFPFRWEKTTLINEPEWLPIWKLLKEHHYQNKLIIAYEPKTAVNQPDPLEREKLKFAIQTWDQFQKIMFDAKIPFIYGGAINLKNCQKWWRQPKLDGLLVGRGSWNHKIWTEIINHLQR